MDLVLVALLAAALGFVLGAAAGGRRAMNMIVAGRSIRAASGQIGFMPTTMPQRTASDILAGRIRISLAGHEYVLPVLARGPARRWLQTLDARFASLAVSLSDAGDDTPRIMNLLVSETDAMYDMLLSYDTSGILPPRDEIDESVTDAQILHAVLEVWRAVHPLVATVTGMLGDEPPTPGPSSVPRNSPPSPMDGTLDASSPA